MAQKKFVDTTGLSRFAGGVKAELDKKPEKDGYYESMGVGTADNLAGRANDSVPASFSFRPAGGTSDIADGTATIKEIKGNTVVWNQWVNNTFPINLIKDNTDSSAATYIYAQILFNLSHQADGSTHKYYSIYDYTINADNNVTASGNYVYAYQKNGYHILENSDLSKEQGRYIKKEIQGYKYDSTAFTPQIQQFYTRINNGSYLDITFNHVIFIDLTQMFGAGNEPATVEEFESMFPLPYYDYNAGELVSFNGTAIKSVGFNAYNPATGKAEVVGGNVYQITGTYTSITLDGVAITPDADGHFTPSHNGELVVVGGNNTDTCIRLSHSGYRDGEYEPYWTAERELPVSKINTDGSITDSSTGKTRLFPNGLLSVKTIHDSITRTGAVKRIGVVDMGALSWTKQSAGVFQAAISDMKTLATSYPMNLLSPLYRLKIVAVAALSDYEFRTYNGDSKTVTFKNSSYADAASFKAAMSGVMLCYELATPIEVTFAEPLNLSYKVSDFGTEQLLPVNGSEPVTTPFNGEIAYGINAVDTLRNLPKNYISKESFTNFTTALGTSLGKTITMTWNAATGEYDFTITDNPTTIE